MTGYKYCAERNSESTSKNKLSGFRYCAFPKKQVTEYSKNWRRVVNKCDLSWTPKKGSVICSKHFSKGDIVGQKLRVGAILIPEEFVLIHTAVCDVYSGRNTPQEAHMVQWKGINKNREHINFVFCF